MAERTVTLEVIKDELRRLREEMERVNPLFTVNIVTNPVVGIRFSAPTFYEECDNFAILSYSEQLVKAYQIIETFEFNGYKAVKE